MNFSNVPWVIGKDIQTPTCATCHNSLLVNPEGEVIAKRSHDFADRLWVRIFGLVYSHPQTKSGKTYRTLSRKQKLWEASRSTASSNEKNTVSNTTMIATIIGEVHFRKTVADAL